ncbi:MAG TPA: hypothetical protein VF177_11475 [Anaerolineae bacterium]
MNTSSYENGRQDYRTTEKTLPHHVIFVNNDSPHLLAEAHKRAFKRVAFVGKHHATRLSALQVKYDIVQTAMFESDTRALTTLVPMSAIDPGEQTILADEEEIRLC